MVREKNAQVAAMILALLAVAGSLVYVPEWSVVGVSPDCTFAARLFYPLFHASVIHALLNAWCLICIVFRYGVSVGALTTAYAVAVLVPDLCLSDTPTVGLSCMCYALMGRVSFVVAQKIYWQVCVLLSIGVGFFFPQVNVWIHLYGYLAGLLVGLLNTPLSCFRR